MKCGFSVMLSYRKARMYGLNACRAEAILRFEVGSPKQGIAFLVFQLRESAFKTKFLFISSENFD